MKEDQKLTIATLAAAIITSRNARTVKEIQSIMTDAEYILYPRPTDNAYKAWQAANELTPITPEEEAANRDQRTADTKRAINQATNASWKTR